MGKKGRKSTSHKQRDTTSASAEVSDEEIRNAISLVRLILRERVLDSSTTRDQVLDIGFSEQTRQLVEVLTKCVEFGESNSAILIGPRGVGKSVILGSALKEVEGLKDSYFYVYLNGLVQTDDRIALQEIARQLHLENVIGDRVHGSFADNLAFILESLRSGGQNTKSVIFVLDEFDLFAQHKNQSLLYNLLDVAQFKQCPVAVIGITCRLDVVELLEKRVKSRYSHRCILAYSSITFDDYMKLFKEVLRLPEDFPYKGFSIAWKEQLEILVNDSEVRSELQHLFNKRKDIKGLLQCLVHPISRLTANHWCIKPSDMISELQELCRDTKLSMLRGLTVLELCLVVAMKHILDRRQGEPFNFEMVFDEYQRFVQRRGASSQKFEKAVALKALEHLISVEIVRSLDSISQTSIPKEFRLMTLLVDSSQILEIVNSYPDCPTELKHWVESMFA